MREEVLDDNLNEEQSDDSETSPSNNPPTPATQLKKRQRREQQKEPTLSNVDKVLEHLSKKRQITSNTLDAVEMLMMSHAKTIKTFSPRRQAIAKKKISEIIGTLEIDQIEENEYGSVSHLQLTCDPTNQTTHDGFYSNNQFDTMDYHQTNQPVALPTQNTDAINLSVQNYTSL